jgi:Cd2+/Zn2+-exporting ATPase
MKFNSLSHEYSKQLQILDVRLAKSSLIRCEPCRTRLHNSFLTQQGVHTIQLDPVRARIRLTFDPELTSPPLLEQALEQLCEQLERERLHLSLPVEGMDCPECAQSIERAVNAVPGVEWAHVHFASAMMELELDPNRAGKREVEKAVQQAGYRVGIPEQPARPLWQEGLPLFLAVIFLTIAGLMDWLVEPRIPIFYGLSILIAGLPVFRGAWISLRTRGIDMNVLMATAAVGAVGIGEWHEASVLMCLFALGNLLQNRTLARTRRAIRHLLDLSPKTARLVANGTTNEVPAETLEVGSIVEIHPGEYVSVDGEIIGGYGSIDESSLTGESVPAYKTTGQAVYAGTINLNGSLRVRAVKPYSDTLLAHMIALVSEDRSVRSRSQQLIDRFAARYTPLVILLAAGIAVFPPILAGANWHDWIYRALWLLVVACPCALVIATPVAVVTALGTASRMGVLVKGGIVLEQLAKVRTLILDKTGTLTYAALQVTEVRPTKGQREPEMLTLAATLAAHSNHPVSRALMEYAHLRRPDFVPGEVSEFDSKAGSGITGRMEGKFYALGNPEWVKQRVKASFEPDLEAALSQAMAQGHTVVLLSDETRPLALFMLSDTVRPQSKQAVQSLQALNIQPMILSGDRQAVTQTLAERMGILKWQANCTPEQKQRIVAEIAQSEGVAMIGDGINDVPALQQATVGFAMGAIGADAAMDAADVVLLRDDLSRVPALIRLANRTMRVMKFNIALALGTKAILILLGLFSPLGLWVAVAGDMGLSLLVTLNALQLAWERKP